MFFMGTAKRLLEIPHKQIFYPFDKILKQKVLKLALFFPGGTQGFEGNLISARRRRKIFWRDFSVN